MIKNNLTEKNRLASKTFQAEFDKYEILKNKNTLWLKDIRNESGELVKDWLWVNLKTDGEPNNSLTTGDLVQFTADYVYNATYHNKFKIINIKGLEKYNE